MLIGIDASRAFIPQKTGTENYSYWLLAALAKIDKKNHYKLYTRYKPSSRDFGELSRVAQAEGIQDTKSWPKNLEFVQINLPRLWTQLGLAAECLLHPPDVLFIPAHTLPVIRRLNLKTVVTIHDLGAQFLPGFHTTPQKFYLTASTKYAVKTATAIIAVSVATKKDLVEKFGADSAKIFVVYEGVNRKKFQISNDKFQIKKILKKYKIQKPYILFVGTVQPRKNLVRLIEAFSRIIHNTKYNIHNFRLVIAGKLGWLYDDILLAPKKFKIEKKVKFLNYIKDSDLSAIYSQAEVFVMPSLVEGFGLPILESFAAGVPVASSDSSSLPEVAGNAALYFDPENTKDMEKAITKVLTNAKLRDELVEKGKKQVEKFSWEKCAEETLKILERTAK